MTSGMLDSPDGTPSPSSESDKKSLPVLLIITASDNAREIIEYLRTGKSERGHMVLDSLRVVTRETLLVLAAIALLTWAWFYDKHHPNMLQLITNTPFWCLAALPGAIGVLYHILHLGPRYRGRKTTVEAYERFTAIHDQWWREQKKSSNGDVSKAAADGQTLQGGPAPAQDLPNPLSELLHDNLRTYAPSLGAALWSSLALTLVFSIPAVISSSNRPAGFPGIHDPTSSIGAPAAQPEAARNPAAKMVTSPGSKVIPLSEQAKKAAPDPRMTGAGK